MVDEQLLPHNTEYERALIGILLVDGEMIHAVKPLVTAADFYDDNLAAMYQGAVALADNNVPIDVVSLSDLLARRTGKPDHKIMAQLTGYINATGNPTAATHYARQIARFAARRRNIQAAAEIARVNYDLNHTDPAGEAFRLLNEANERISGGARTSQEIASSLYDQIEAWASEPLEPGQVRGLAARLADVDILTQGMRAGDLILLAGRPSMGKSALAFEIGRRVAVQGKGVAVFSLEMTGEKVYQRWAAAVSGVDTKRVERGVCPDKFEGQPIAARYVTSAELTAYMKALSDISNLPVIVDDQPALTADDIRARAMAYAQRHELALIIVDHSGLMKGSARKGENSSKVEGRKSQVMKELAKELACPVILVQQLNRAVEHRQNKRPSLSDLRDSGEHEQNADVVLAVYRDSYYNDYPEGSQKDLELEILCLKHRDGEAGTSRKVRYERHLSRFTEWMP